MIEVRIEIIPGGNRRVPPKARGVIQIVNTGGSRVLGEYGYVILAGTGAGRRVLHKGAIKGFPRRSSDAKELVRRVLNDALGDAAPPPIHAPLQDGSAWCGATGGQMAAPGVPATCGECIEELELVSAAWVDRVTPPPQGKWRGNG